MWNSQRQTSTPTSAISPATTAVATPPDHSIRASTLVWRRRSGGYAGCSWGYGRLPGVLGSIGMVIVSQAFRQAGRAIRSLGPVWTLTHRPRSKHAPAQHSGIRSGPGVDDLRRPRAVH